MKAALLFIFTVALLAISTPVLAQSERLSEADYSTAFAKALESVPARDRRVVTIEKFYNGAQLVGTRKTVTEFGGPDAKKVEAGYGQKIKGMGDWEGEITGKPAPNASFSKLQIGMSMRQVVDLVGQPTDQGAYVTGKAWIPFYFGSDRHRFEMVYKGQGRLIFAGGSLGNFTGGNLIWIIHSATEGGYR